MPVNRNMTKVFQRGREPAALEANTAGFSTHLMADCSFLAVLWERTGMDFQHGRAQHCAGGLAAAWVNELFDGIPDNATVVIVIIKGRLWTQALDADREMLLALQTRAAGAGWGCVLYDAKEIKTDTLGEPHKHILLRNSHYLSLDEFEAGANLSDKLERKQSTCCSCVIM